MKTELLENTRELKEKFLMDMLVGNSNLEQLNRRFEYFYGMPSPSSCYVAVLDVYFELGGEEEKSLILGMGCMLLVEILVQRREGINVVQDNSGRVVILSWEAANELELIGEQSIRAIKEKLGYDATVGIESAYDSLIRVNDSYREALEALRYGKLVAGGQVISFGEDIRISDYTMDLRRSEMEEIVFYAKTGMKEQAVHAIDSLFRSLASTRGATLEQAYSFGIHLLSLLIHAMLDLGFIQLRSDLMNGTLYNRIFGCRTVGDLSQLLTQLSEDAADYVKGIRIKRTNRITNAVIAHLSEEFRNPEISLRTVSQKFHLNSSYLSRIFKQEMVQSLTDFLLKLRIDEAVRLLNETDMKAYQIAEKVRIKDPYYFSHRFKKVIGVSVQEYKRSSQL